MPRHASQLPSYRKKCARRRDDAGYDQRMIDPDELAALQRLMLMLVPEAERAAQRP
jgi:hypothetical protein